MPIAEGTAQTTDNQPSAEELQHQQRLADAAPLESEDAARAAFEELAAGVIDDAPAMRETPREEPTPQPEQQPTPAVKNPDAVVQQAQANALGLSQEDIDALRALPTQFKTVAGRVAKLQGDMEKMGKAAATATAASGDAAPTQQAIKAASGDMAKWKKLTEEFPEWGAAFEERLAAAGTTALTDDEKEQIRNQAKAEALQQMRQEREAEREAEIAESHKDWKDTLRSDAFKAWFKQQPEDYQVRLYNSHSARSITGMLDKFEGARQQSSSSAPAHAAARVSTAPAVDLAAAVTKRGGAAIPKRSVDELDGKELWDALAAEGTATR